MNLEGLFSIQPFDWVSIGVSVLCGGIIGLERQLRGKPVGIRTSSLIVLGTYIFILSSLSVQNEATDTSRIIGQVVTGIGFLGAGVMLAKDGAVIGVTSAATIWVLAAIGVVIAVVDAFMAFKLSLLVIMLLSGVDLLEDYSSHLTKGVHEKYKKWQKRVNK